jgi:hypothetical protein
MENLDDLNLEKEEKWDEEYRMNFKVSSAV